MFPYPSGEGLHVGHPKGYIATDVYSRMYKMKGHNILRAMGWDAFGLPAEQFAIKNKVNPKISTKKNTDNYKKQLSKIGFNYDWEREINTTSPDFYKWTQYIFKQLYKAGLCYESHEPINWCPSCKTGLANEDLEDGKCERCGSVVEKKPIRQWVIKITEYAEKLLDGLDGLGWKENVKDMQRNWIGKSEGAEIDFKLVGADTTNSFTIFTTRPDTLFGCTYCVFAPEHKLVKEYLDKNLITNKSEVEKYINDAKGKTEIERGSEGKEKTGVKLEGVYAINPTNQKQIPVYIADYVLSTYGSGAIMAVPAHDERDFEFANKFAIEIIDVIDSDKKIEGELFTENGVLVNSGEFDGMKSEEAKRKITEFVGGKMVTKYKLRDWVFARQRYWGEPFPIVFDENHKSYLVADKDLPVVLPDVKNYEPTGDGESPLKNITKWVEVYGSINKQGEFEIYKKKVTKELLKKGKGTLMSGGTKIKKFFRETNTMPQWAGSSWYWLRYMDPKNNKFLAGKKEEKYWGQVDLYCGGMEHATRHLIYGRFWNRFMYDKKLISTKEPFNRLEGVGLIMANDGRKMSKRYGNVINPDDVIERFGADTFRMYEMFIGAFHDTVAWSENGLVGPRRFIERVWGLQNKVGAKVSPEGGDLEGALETLLNQTIKKVSEDYEDWKFNTAISQMMIFVNEVEKQEFIDIKTYKILLQLLSPICPFFTEEIWNSLGEKKSIYLSEWPKYNPKKIINQNVNIALQVNGKLRDTFTCAVDLSDEEVKKLAENTEGYKKWIVEAKAQIRKVIIIKNKIVNIVI